MIFEAYSYAGTTKQGYACQLVLRKMEEQNRTTTHVNPWLFHFNV